MECAIRQVMRGALPEIADPELDCLVRAFSVPRLRAQYSALGLCDARAPDSAVAQLYFDGRCAVSPNDYFDETWYLDYYPDVRQALGSPIAFSGFVHFIRRGIAELRWPNPVLAGVAAACSWPEPSRTAIDDALYLSRHPEAAQFLRAFPGIDCLQHFNAYGRRLGYRAEPDSAPSEARRVVQSGFDAAFYARTYLNRDVSREAALAAYIESGMALGHAPNAWFDEAWYRAFYPDVRMAIARGAVPCGYYHYLVTGRAEGRAASHDLTVALEARMPGVTRPALLERLADLQARLDTARPLPACDGRPRPRRRRRIWVVFPTLNPDIMFGGYRAALRLLEALHHHGYELVVVCAGEAPNPEYLLHHERSPGISEALHAATYCGPDDFAAATIAPGDRFMAYSIWDLPLCARLAERAGAERPLLLAQEYEPVFYDCGANRAVCEELYLLPHVAIFNSAMLESYFRQNRLGVFAPVNRGRAGVAHATFEHCLHSLPPQSLADLKARELRHCVLYARPEAHAARNLFEVAVMALRRCCKNGTFSPRWQFTGVGALSELPPVPLAAGHELRLRRKTSEAEYIAAVRQMDIGISLMYAPHPSLVPFEFATGGALVITNTFESRTAEQLRTLSPNILPCEPTIGGVASALFEAVRRCENHEARIAGALRTPARSWAQVFSPEFLRGVFGEPAIAARPRPAPARPMQAAKVA